MFRFRIKHKPNDSKLHPVKIAQQRRGCCLIWEGQDVGHTYIFMYYLCIVYQHPYRSIQLS